MARSAAGPRGPKSVEPRRGRPPGGGAGDLLALIRRGRAHTKAELGAATGLARATVAKQMDLLVESGLVLLEGERVSAAAGRPAAHYAFNPKAGVVLVADLGVTGAHLAVADLGGATLAEEEEAVDLTRGPDKVLAWAAARWTALLKQAGQPMTNVRGVGVGLPGTVDVTSGRPTDARGVPGWNGADVPAMLSARLGRPVPVRVDGNVNLMALAERDALGDVTGTLLFVRAATGIGCALVLDGKLHRGAHGVAGDLGHVPVADGANVLCACGNHGCVEALAGGAALARALTQQGIRASSSRDVVRALRAGKPEAIRLVRQAGRWLGEALSPVVSVLDPGLVVLGGDYAEVGDHLITGVREALYQRALPSTTRTLRIVPSRMGHDAGVRGAAVMAVEQVLAPGAVDRQLGLLGTRAR